MNKRRHYRVLVTGSSGFIGNAIYNNLKKRGDEVIGIDLDGDEGMIRVDISNSQKFANLLKICDPEIVIHSAAIKSLQECERSKIRSWKVNVGSTETIVQYSYFHPKTKVIYISSDVIFDGIKGNYKETDLPHPINWYGKTKLHSEFLIRQLKNIAICRTALVLGNLSENNLLQLKNEMAKPILNNQTLFPHYVFNRLLNRQQVRFPSNIISSPTHVNLIVEAIGKIIEFDLKGVFHCTGSEPISRFDLAKKIASYCFLDSKLVSEDNSKILKFRPKNLAMNVEKTYRQLKIDPNMENIDSILKDINFYRIA